MSYIITSEKSAARTEVEKWLYGLDLVSAATREKIITAWQTTWTSSTYTELERIPWDPSCDSYTLKEHVNEVTRFGLSFAKEAQEAWNVTLDPEILVPILILHDVDKPLMFTADGQGDRHSVLYNEIPHGVVGGMLLKELAFPHTVISTVATHSPRMPFPGRNYEAFILHYADHFCCDNAVMRAGQKPLYFHLELPPLAD